MQRPRGLCLGVRVGRDNGNTRNPQKLLLLSRQKHSHFLLLNHCLGDEVFSCDLVYACVQVVIALCSCVFTCVYACMLLSYVRVRVPICVHIASCMCVHVHM